MWSQLPTSACEGWAVVRFDRSQPRREGSRSRVPIGPPSSAGPRSRTPARPQSRARRVRLDRLRSSPTLLASKGSMSSAGWRGGGVGRAGLTLLVLLAGLASTAMAAGAGKVVRYRGMRMTVPRSWPVYDLTRDPRVTVRFDRHAV